MAKVHGEPSLCHDSARPAAAANGSRGLGTPAPIAPTRFLVTTALHRRVRNPMYIGVALVILGEAALFRSLHLVLYAAVMLGTAHLFVIFYEEPTLRRQFGKSYDEYFGSVPRWIPKW